jgi:excisionase family DNA binding protein
MEVLTPEEVASFLKIEPKDVVQLIETGELRAYKVGSVYRVGQKDVDAFLESCSTSSRRATGRTGSRLLGDPLRPNDARKCKTFAGLKEFQVSGSIAAGAQIWPGQMRYPIRFPKEFFDALLGRFRGREINVGLQFDRPAQGSLGEWIKKNLPTKMNPATYVAGLLIDEGYAVRSGRGTIRFNERRKPGSKEE